MIKLNKKERISNKNLVGQNGTEKLRERVTNSLFTLRNLKSLQGIDVLLSLEAKQILPNMHGKYRRLNNKDKKKVMSDLKALAEDPNTSTEIRVLSLLFVTDREIMDLKDLKKFIPKFFNEEDLMVRDICINRIVGKDMLNELLDDYEHHLLKLKSELVESFYRYMDFSGRSEYVHSIPFTILKEGRNYSLCYLVNKENSFYLPLG